MLCLCETVVDPELLRGLDKLRVLEVVRCKGTLDLNDLPIETLYLSLGEIDVVETTLPELKRLHLQQTSSLHEKITAPKLEKLELLYGEYSISNRFPVLQKLRLDSVKLTTPISELPISKLILWNRSTFDFELTNPNVSCLELVGLPTKVRLGKFPRLYVLTVKGNCKERIKNLLSLT